MSVSAAAGDGSVRYYLLFGGLDGGSADKGFQDAFEVTAAELEVLSSGVRPSFDMLELELKAGSSLDELMRTIITGRKTETVQLVGVIGSGKDAEIVSDLKLADVSIGSIGMSDHDTTSIGLRYSSIELGTSNGKLFESFGWNLTANSERTMPIDAPETLNDNATGDFGGVTWSLFFTGLDGGGKGRSFSVAGFDMSLENTGGSSGRFTLGTLDLKLEFGSAADNILQRMMSGMLTSGIQLVGTAEGKTVYDLRMAEVAIAGAHVHSKGFDEMSLTSRALSLTTTNKAGDSETVSYNRATTETGSTALSEAVAGSEKGLNGGKTTYYLVIDGLDGGSRVKGHEGAFALSSFDFGGTNVSNRFTPDDLTVNFEAGSNLDELLARLMSGSHFANGLRIVGDTTVGGKVISAAYDLRLDSLSVNSLQQDSGGSDSVVFGYGAYSLTTKNLDGLANTVSLNRATTEISSTKLTAAEAATDQAGATPSSATDYYMVIGGLDGGVGGKDHNLAFAINDFTIGAERIGSNGNSGSGTLQFSQLRVDLDLGSSVAELMDRVGSNTAFSVQIVGDDPKVKGKSIVYDLRLDAAVLQSLATGQGKGHDALVFNYGDYSITTRNGAGETETTGLNRTTTEILTEPLTAAEGANRGALPDQPMKYYLVLDGIDGGSTAKGHKGAFEIDSFDFDMFRQSNRAFSGVDLKLDLGSAEDEIMRLAASGAFLQTAQIVGDTLGKNGKPGVYDLRLGDVIVSGLTHNAGPRDGLSLKYGDMSLSTKNENGLVSTSGYDFGTRNTTTTRLEAPEAKTDDNWLGAGKTTYWLVLDGVSSGAGGKQHAGAFALDGFDFSVLNNTAGGSGSGSGSGRPLFLPLQAMLDSGTAADELLGMIAKGMHISSAQIVGEAKVGKSVETVYDLRLSDVIVTDYGLLDNNSIAFDYEAFTVSTMNRKGQMETAGLDITHGTLLTTPLDL